MKNAYEKIKAILSTGVHKVEVEFERDFTPKVAKIIEYDGDGRFFGYFKGEHTKFSHRDIKHVVSIKPIPLKPNPLPVGTNVRLINEEGELTGDGTIADIENGLYRLTYYQGTSFAQPWEVIPLLEDGEEKEEEDHSKHCS